VTAAPNALLSDTDSGADAPVAAGLVDMAPMPALPVAAAAAPAPAEAAEVAKLVGEALEPADGPNIDALLDRHLPADSGPSHPATLFAIGGDAASGPEWLHAIVHPAADAVAAAHEAAMAATPAAVAH